MPSIFSKIFDSLRINLKLDKSGQSTCSKIKGNHNHVEQTINNFHTIDDIASKKHFESRSDTTIPGPREIREDINSHPPYQCDAISESYIGQEIRWLVNIYSIKKSENKCVVMAKASPTGHFVQFKVDIEKYPRIKLIKKEENITVHGKISGIDPNIIFIDEARLS